MKVIFSFLLVVLTLWCYHYAIAEKAVRLKNAEKTIEYQDKIYDPDIRTILLYPLLNTDNPASRALNPAVQGLRENGSLQVEFDYLSENYQGFRAKVFHCNPNWSPSVLAEVEYLPEYNDFPIQDYQLSSGTKTSFYHYTLTLPTMKIAGNYVLVVHKDGNPKDIAFTRRFLVYDNKVNIAAKVNFSSGISQRQSHQQVDFQLRYGANYTVLNPQQDFRVLIRQNFRDDKTVSNLKPFMVYEGERRVEYNFMNLENSFAAGNEYRMFDARSTRTKLTNIAQIAYDPDQTKILLMTDTPQGNKAYIEVQDFDGQYAIDHYETHEGGTAADYVRVTFTLRMPELMGKRVYVGGKFNDWLCNDRNRMAYFDDLGAYRATLELKQGIYNYEYVAEDPITNTFDPRPLEGSHSLTQNTYEILVYHKPLGSRVEQLVGYQVVKYP